MDTVVQCVVQPALLERPVVDLSYRLEEVSHNNRPLSRPGHFGVDIDGTFLCADVDVLAKNRRAFANALKAGYRVFFCTGECSEIALSSLAGRPHVSSMAVLDDEFVRSTGYRGYPGIYHNGAVVYDHNGVVLRMCKFSEVFISEFCQYVISRELQRSVVFCDMEDTYMLCDDSSQMTNILADVDVYTLPTLVDTADLARKNITLIIVGNGEIMTKQAHLQCNVDYVMKEGSFGAWDVTPCTVTKAEGLNVLLANYNATGSDCGFIGNGTNDIEAMRLCHISFAVGNAEPGVKEHAKYTLHETNNSGAFHKTMELVYGVPCD